MYFTKSTFVVKHRATWNSLIYFFSSNCSSTGDIFIASSLNRFFSTYIGGKRDLSQSDPRSQHAYEDTWTLINFWFPMGVNKNSFLWSRRKVPKYDQPNRAITLINKNSNIHFWQASFWIQYNISSIYSYKKVTPLWVLSVKIITTWLLPCRTSHTMANILYFILHFWK